MTVDERLELFLMSHTAASSGVMLEVGSYLGASSTSLSEGLRRKLSSGKLYCVDTWENDAMSEGKRPTFEIFDNNTSKWKSFIQIVRGNSRTVDIPPVENLDLVFIDGDHSYEGAKSDAVRFSPLVRVGGLLMFHDSDRTEVARVIGETLAQGNWVPYGHVHRLTTLRRMQ
tara:strand:+ start:755 stop:1267 length:513 start_codon:yes stop_codon:yes gene_type:complete